jgi:hypothetical protein
MNHRRFSQLKWLGIFLILIAFGLIPLTLLAFAIFRPSLSEQDNGMAVAGLMVLSGDSLAAGVGILVLESRFSQRNSNSN